VLFRGTLLANTGLKQQQSFNGVGSAGGGTGQLLITNQLPWSSLRITGTAVVSDTNNFEINAVPQLP